MINIKDEADSWSAEISSLGASTIEKFVQAGQHWIQIKSLEQTQQTVFGGLKSEQDFESKMRGVAEFLFNLNKKIGQKP